MYCLHCGREIEDNSIVCEFCGTNFEEVEKAELKAEKQKKEATVKDFILKIGRILVDIDTNISIGFAILIMVFCWLSIFVSFIPDNEGSFSNIIAVPFLIPLSIILPIIIIFFVVISKYLIYLLIDIRDSLKELKEMKKEEISND